jgi:hypothetical protein
MNNRIKELADQARMFAVLTVDTDCEGSLDEALDRTFEAKFAELIINDCLVLVKNRTGGPYDISMSTETRRTWNIWVELKEHFGVTQ